MRLIAALIALAILTSGSAIRAQDYPFPRPDLPARAKPNWPPRIDDAGVRRVATFTGPEDSKCIGRPTTVECAIDSEMACVWQANWQACTTIGWSTEDIIRRRAFLKESYQGGRAQVIDYRIDIIGPLAPYRVEARLMDLGFKEKRDFTGYFKRGWKMKPGDLFAIVSERWCMFWPNLTRKAPSWNCDGLGTPSDGVGRVFQLRHVHGFWTIVDGDSLIVPVDQDGEIEDDAE